MMSNEKINIGNGVFYIGDCFEIMRDFPDNSVDMILNDPPYGTQNWKSPESWDSVLPFDFMWKEYWRLLSSKNSAIALFGNEPFSTILKYSQLSKYKYDYVWIKSISGGFMNAKVKPLKKYELISIFSEGTTSPGRSGNMIYNPQGIIRINKTVKQSTNKDDSRIGVTIRDNSKQEYTQEYTNYPCDILQYHNETGLHPTQKPVKLFEHLIKTYTTENMVVFDNTAGSGTTAIAAENVNRRWICIEKDIKYARKAIQRIQDHITKKETSLDKFMLS